MAQLKTTPAKRTIIAEWKNWAKKNSEAAKTEYAFGSFYLHLEREASHLLTFSAKDKLQKIRAWLVEEGYLKD